MANKDEAGKEQARQVGELLNFQLEAATSEDATTKGARLTLALICVLGAFGVAGWLVVEGPPAPNPPATTAKTSPSNETKGTKGPQGTKGAQSGGAKQQPGGQPGAATAPTTTTTPAADAAEGSTLSEEAPWVFAIVALVVAAFLAAGQSIRFGGANSAKGGAKEGGGSPADTGEGDVKDGGQGGGGGR